MSKVKNESSPVEETPSAGAASESLQTAKREWTWNHEQYGYEGVHLHEGEVLWFEHRHNTLEGGVARSQSFADFLENGPTCPLPAEFLAELHATVKSLVSQRQGKRSFTDSPKGNQMKMRVSQVALIVLIFALENATGQLPRFPEIKKVDINTARPGPNNPTSNTKSTSTADWTQSREMVMDDGFTYFDAAPATEYSAASLGQIDIGWYLKSSLRLLGTFPNRSH